MPLYNPPPAAAGGGIVSIDGDGYITLTGYAGLPFKDVDEDLGNGFIRVHHMVKHPTLGEITSGFEDFPAP